MGIKTWFNGKKELKEDPKKGHSLSAREYLINSILNREYMLKMWQDAPEDLKVKDAIVETTKEMIDLVEKFQDMSYDELYTFRDNLEYKIEAARFKQMTEYAEKVAMIMIYQEHGESINEILYGSKEKSKEKVKTIR